MKLLTVSTTHNQFTKDWENSAKIYGYNYEILGVGEPWKGFNTKMQLLIQFLQTQRADELMVVTDAYDLLMTGPPEELERKFKKLHKPIVIGAESGCSLNCDRSGADTCAIEGVNRYPNGGFVMGSAQDLLHLYEHAKQHGNGDDQVGFSSYWKLHCADVHLDAAADFVFNLYSVTEIKFDTKLKRFIHRKTKSKPCAVHMPALHRDLGVRSNFVRGKIIPNFKSNSTDFHVKGIVQELSKNMWYPVYADLWVPILLLIMIVILIPFCVLLGKNKNK